MSLRYIFIHILSIHSENGVSQTYPAVLQQIHAAEIDIPTEYFHSYYPKINGRTACKPAVVQFQATGDIDGICHV